MGISTQGERMPITSRILMLDQIEIYARAPNDNRRYLNFANSRYHVYRRRYVTLKFYFFEWVYQKNMGECQ